MLLRIIAENIASFKQAVEFNTFPASKSHSHDNHKIACGHATALRLAAIYGANGAGKSNLLSILALLQQFALVGSLQKILFEESLAFKLDAECIKRPSGVAVEFYNDGKIFYYHIEFDKDRVFLEELYLSRRSKDEIIFKRENDVLSISKDYFANGYNEQFLDGLRRLLRADMISLSLIGKYYANEFPIIEQAYAWFVEKLKVVAPNSAPFAMPHALDKDKSFEKLVNSVIPEIGSGISELRVSIKPLDEDKVEQDSRLYAAIKDAKNNPGDPQLVLGNNIGEFSNVVCEDGKILLKTLVAIHKGVNGNIVEMPLSMESDGTRRIIEYMPILYVMNKQEAVYVVDEMERSIHPILIKNIIRKLSESSTVRGQLLFTTHESALLDQDIFRPDEIWFAQKDVEQATQLYPLSDFNIHKTASIENGYLNGRYGGIPFLSNLKDLNW
ncbi:MAG: ATP-binding protein [Paludibacteraceae bacterium]|nr:ATP-binding protein [Paludibacteraceae bacterium]